MGKTILTVDDSSTVRLVLSTTLKDAGYKVVEAVNAQDAIKQLDSGRINMLITDLNIPRADGLDLIRSVRRNPEYRFLPILMLTTEADGEKRKQGQMAGASGWVVKPLKPEQLLTVVKMVMS